MTGASYEPEANVSELHFFMIFQGYATWHPAPGRANFRSIFYLWRFFVIMTILRGTIQTQEHRFKLRSTY